MIRHMFSFNQWKYCNTSEELLVKEKSDPVSFVAVCFSIDENLMNVTVLVIRQNFDLEQ